MLRGRPGAAPRAGFALGSPFLALGSPPGTEAPPAVHHSAPPQKYAHKGPELDNTARTQGRNQALVCDGVLRNSVRCVRNRGGRGVRALVFVGGGHTAVEATWAFEQCIVCACRDPCRIPGRGPMAVRITVISVPSVSALFVETRMLKRTQTPIQLHPGGVSQLPKTAHRSRGRSPRAVAGIGPPGLGNQSPTSPAAPSEAEESNPVQTLGQEEQDRQT